MKDNEAIDEMGRTVLGQPSFGFHGSKIYVEANVRLQGLPADGGQDRRIDMHVAGHANSAFRGTVKLIAGNGRVVRAASDYAGEGGLVFDICGVIGWDTDVHAAKVSSRNAPREAEVAILRAVPPAKIKRIATVVRKRRGSAEFLLPGNWRTCP